jgi:hypothetical protein
MPTYKYNDPVSLHIRAMPASRLHDYLCHPYGDKCPDGCATPPNSERVCAYNMSLEECDDVHERPTIPATPAALQCKEYRDFMRG